MHELRRVIIGLIAFAALPATAKPLRTEADVREAIAHARESCTADDAGACHTLAQLSERYPSLGVPYAQQVAFSAKACNAGSQEACTTWGRLLYMGPLLDHDLDRIHKLWADACDGDSMEACRRLGSLYAHREVEPKGNSTNLKNAKLQGAYEALFFDSARARVLARNFLGDRDYADRARLLLACADISEQKWDQAIAKVENRKAIDPAYAVLEALIKERQTHPKDPWADTYVRAWIAAGKPDLRNSMLFGFAPPLPRPVLKDPKDPTARFVLHLAAWLSKQDENRDEWHEPVPEALVSEALSQATSTDPVSQHLALRVLLARGNEAATDAAKHVIDAWMKTEPDNLAPAFLGLGLTPSKSVPLRLKELERVAALPSYRSNRFEAFQYFLAALVAYSPAAAFDVSFRTSDAAGFTDIGRGLIQEASSSVGAMTAVDGKEWAPALHAIGTKLQGATTERERNTAKALLAFTTIVPSQPEPVEAKEPSSHWSDRSEDLLLVWPVPALREEAYFKLAEDEVAYRKHLDDLLATPTTPPAPVSEHLNKSVP